MQKKVIISDPTLRDGNHAIQHRMSLDQVDCYARAADAAGVPIIEVGHGNGLGASSLQVGLSAVSDRDMLRVAREAITKAKLCVHCIPSFATINKDLKPAIDIGVDIVRVATHVTEADVTQRQIGYVRERGKEAYGALMMAHMAPVDRLVEECVKLESYGAQAIILMDSVGGLLPDDVTDRISHVVAGVKVPVCFHAHNNLGMAIANSLAALNAGATMLDATACGFGAGAGNAQLEVLVAVLGKLNYDTGIDLYKILDAAEIAEKYLMTKAPSIRPTSIVSGLAGVFSAFSKHVDRISKQYDVDPRDVFFELGRRKVVGGQEDIIIEVAMNLVKAKGAATC